jgi:DNA-binding response OmpR family regulator
MSTLDVPVNRHGRPVHGHQTVLVVDDDPGVTQTFARILRLSGYDVQTALNAEVALKQFEAIHPDVVLLDLRMPLVDGLAVLRSLRQHERDRLTPVGIITGDYTLDDALRRELFTLGASIYFKPVWLEDLLVITNELLGRAH